MCWSDSADRRGAARVAAGERKGGRLVGCASATRVLRVVITRHLQPARTTLRPPPPPSPLPSPPPTCLPHSLRWDRRRGRGERGGLVGRGRRIVKGMRQRGVEGWVATVLILSKTADAAAADAAANQTHLWWYPLGYNTDSPPHIPPRLVSYSFSFEHITARLPPRAPLVLSSPSLPLGFSRFLSSRSPSLSLFHFASLLSNLRYPLVVSYSHRALDKMLRKPHTSAKYPLRRAVLSIRTGTKRIVRSIVDRGSRITRTQLAILITLVIFITYIYQICRQSLLENISQDKDII